jgi:hypothetical protein
MPPPDCTLVTGCFDLTKYNPHSRTIDESIRNMSALLATPVYLFIFTDQSMFLKIQQLRDSFGYNELTRYFVYESVESLETFKYQQIVHKNRETYHPTRDARTCPESHLVCCSKFQLTLNAIKINPFNTSKFGWIDANIGVNFSKICTNYKNHMLLKALHNCNKDKFTIQILNMCDAKFVNREHLREYYSCYRWVVCGCLFVVGIDVGKTVLSKLNQVFEEHTMLGYGHGEEMFYLEVLNEYPDLFKRYYGDYNFILNSFNNLENASSENIQYISNISNAFLNAYQYDKCIECCNQIVQLYENYSIEIDYVVYLKLLFNLYVAYFYRNREMALKTKENFYKWVNAEPKMMELYKSNKAFYDMQFSYIK